MAIVFNMGSQSRLAEGIEIADTRILLTSYDTMLDKGGAGDTYYAQMINAAGEKEVVLVDVGNSDPVQGLSVTRGVESTAAAVWGAGTIIWQVLSETSLGLIKQEAADRQVAFIPDGVLSSNYLGEKVYQTDLRLWWKAVAAGTDEWRLIAGEILGWVLFDDLSAVASSTKILTEHGGNLFVGCSSEELFMSDGAASFSQVAATVVGHSTNSLYSFGGSLYGGFFSGAVRVWDGVSAWNSAGNAGSGNINAMVDDGVNLYAVSHDVLYRFNGGTSWTLVANGPAGVTHIKSLTYDTSDIYGGGDDGTLYRFTGAAWAAVAGTPIGTNLPYILTYSGDGEIYMADSSGAMYRHNGTDYFSVAASPGVGPEAFVQLAGKIYMGLWAANGNLWEWPGSGAVFNSVAPNPAPPPSSFFWMDYTVFNGKIWACSYSDELIYRVLNV